MHQAMCISLLCEDLQQLGWDFEPHLKLHPRLCRAVKQPVPQIDLAQPLCYCHEDVLLLRHSRLELRYVRQLLPSQVLACRNKYPGGAEAESC